MPKAIMKCRVCGKMYEACRSLRNGSSVFNWREVACSPECGTIYLQRVTASRSKQDEPVVPDVKGDKPVQKVSKRKKAAQSLPVDIMTDVVCNDDKPNDVAYKN